MLKKWIVGSAVLLALVAGAAERPNVLFISVDDLNDWVGVFGGHPQCKTPHIDQFAEKAIGPGMVNRKRMGYNDVGWGILPGNYCRFLEQVEPGSGDVGVWHVDQSIYGRFARSFDHESGKKQLRFHLHEKFNAEEIKVRIVYLDRGQGRWSLGVSGKSGRKQMRNSNSGEWKTLEIPMPRKVLHNAELLLRYEGGNDTVFHMVEISSSSAGLKNLTAKTR